MNNQKEPSIATDEIDIRLLFIQTVSTLRRYKVLVILCLLAGIGAGLGFNFLKKPVYVGDMVVGTYILDDENSALLVATLGKLVEEKNYSQLATLLNLPRELVKDVVSINASIVSNSLEYLDPVEQRDVYFINVQVELLTKNNMDDVGMGVLNYLRNNEYVQSRVNKSKEILKSKIKYLDMQLGQIEELKEKVNSGELQKNANGNLIISDLGKLYQESAVLYSQKVGLEYKLKFTNNFEILRRFVISGKSKKDGMIKSMLFGLGLGLMGSFILILIKETSAYLTRFEKQLAS